MPAPAPTSSSVVAAPKLPLLKIRKLNEHTEPSPRGKRKAPPKGSVKEPDEEGTTPRRVRVVSVEELPRSPVKASTPRKASVPPSPTNKVLRMSTGEIMAPAPAPFSRPEPEELPRSPAKASTPRKASVPPSPTNKVLRMSTGEIVNPAPGPLSQDEPAALRRCRPRRDAGTTYGDSDSFREFLRRLRTSDPTLGVENGRVLRLKQFVPSDIGPRIIEQIIDALADNTTVEALYIQNFEKAMQDPQLERLTGVLRLGRIWALNCGENFRISKEGWRKFKDALPTTQVAYLYVSEHHLYGTGLKDQMREAIRNNRNVAPERAVEVIRAITNMWYNPKTPKELERSRRERALKREQQEKQEALERELAKQRRAKERAKLKGKKKGGAKGKTKASKKIKKKKAKSKGYTIKPHAMKLIDLIKDDQFSDQVQIGDEIEHVYLTKPRRGTLHMGRNKKDGKAFARRAQDKLRCAETDTMRCDAMRCADFTRTYSNRTGCGDWQGICVAECICLSVHPRDQPGSPGH